LPVTSDGKLYERHVTGYISAILRVYGTTKGLESVRFLQQVMFVGRDEPVRVAEAAAASMDKKAAHRAAFLFG
jgi:hypothetical protein